MASPPILSPRGAGTFVAVLPHLWRGRPPSRSAPAGTLHLEGIELFQTGRAETGPGSLVRLPLGKHRLTGQRYHFVTSEGSPSRPACASKCAPPGSPAACATYLYPAGIPGAAGRRDRPLKPLFPETDREPLVPHCQNA